MDPRQMQKMMQQMGIKSEMVKATRVVIETEGGNIVVSEPQVMAIEMQGQKSFQVSGVVGEEKAGPSAEDVQLVREQTGAGEEAARKALEEEGGDLAAAILKLKKK